MGDGPSGRADLHLIIGVREQVQRLLLIGQQQSEGHLRQHAGGPGHLGELHVRSDWTTDTRVRVSYPASLSLPLIHTLTCYTL